MGGSVNFSETQLPPVLVRYDIIYLQGYSQGPMNNLCKSPRRMPSTLYLTALLLFPVKKGIGCYSQAVTFNNFNCF